MATKNNAQEFEVTVTGKGKPVLLFPGFACTAEVYKGIVNELSSHYEVHSFTFAGFGKVPPITFPWLPKIKDALQVYIQKNHINKPVIIGHSLGGVLGLWLTAEEPKAYSKLIVIDALPATGAIMMPNYKSENITYENPHNKKIIEMNTRDFTNMAKQMVQSMSLNKEVHQQLTDWMVMSDRSTFVYGYTDFLKLDLRDKLADITIPVSIYAATYPFGMEVKQTNYKTQYANLKNYTLNFAENSGHFIMYDKPEWFLKQIKSELSIK
ncbi:alpha/beta hydrolase [Chryseobacterium sp. Tr-659]|nr:alpha/beta hydrolase [Chryseobacterium sp. Tr-659]